MTRMRLRIVRLTQFAIGVVLFACLQISATTAGGIHIRVNLKHPLAPVQVSIGNTSVTPSVLPVPASVHVDGNGTVAKIVNGTDKVLQTPVTVANNIVTWPAREVDSIKQSITNKIAQAEDTVNGFLRKIEEETPVVIAWVVAGLFIIIAGGVVVGELFTHIVIAGLRRLSGKGAPSKAT